MLYVCSVTVKDRSLAYLLVGRDGALIETGGALSAYGLERIWGGEFPGENLLFLEGLLPVGDSPVFLPRVKTESGLCADVHIFSGEQGDWIVLLDASLEEARERMLQQSMNELKLLRRKLAKRNAQWGGRDKIISALPSNQINTGNSEKQG